MNIECDFVWPESDNLEQYKANFCSQALLSAAPDELLERLKQYVADVLLITTFKTAYTDENVKVYHDAFPHVLSECLGISYSNFTFPKNVKLSGTADEQAELFMELVKPEGADCWFL